MYLYSCIFAVSKELTEDIKTSKMKPKFILKTANQKFVSDVYFSNGLDFETLNEADAKVFDLKEDAEKVIKSNGWDENFVYPIKLEIENG